MTAGGIDTGAEIGYNGGVEAKKSWSFCLQSHNCISGQAAICEYRPRLQVGRNATLFASTTTSKPGAGVFAYLRPEQMCGHIEGGAMTRRITTIDAMALERKAKTSDNWGGILELDPTTLLYLLADRADDIARIATLEAQVNVLAKYASEFDDEGWCPACDAYNHHAPDCELKRVLDALQQRAQ